MLGVTAEVGGRLPMVNANRPKGLPGSIAATRFVPRGFREAEKLPAALGVAILPPKLTTESFVGSRPAGVVTLPVTLATGIVVNEKVYGVPSWFSA
jgi:hypothetical protein